jgi:hypothetical protein
MGNSGVFHENLPELKRNYETKSGVTVLCMKEEYYA